MRAREFLSEDYMGQLNTTLNNILVAAKGAGSSEIKTDDLIDQLQKAGYSSINSSSIMSLLSNNTSVLNATPEIVKISDADLSPDVNSDSASKVKELARKSVNRQKKED